MRGFLLSAGFGQRLGQLGEEVPKALMPLGGLPQIQFSLYKLRNCGVSEVGINLHHKAELVVNTLGDHFQGLKLRYFYERNIQKSHTLLNLYFLQLILLKRITGIIDIIII